jgi:hypothetical protein
MPRHPSVPDNQTEWVRLGAVTTEQAKNIGKVWVGLALAAADDAEQSDDGGDGGDGL